MRWVPWLRPRPAPAWTVGFTCVTSVCGLNANALILRWNGTAWSRSSG